MRGLILDSNEDNRVVYRTILERFGYQIDEQSSIGGSTEILDAVQTYDFIILPLSLPAYTALRIAEYVQQLQLPSRVVLVSATGGDRCALETIFDAFLQRPVEARRLVEIVERVLSEPVRRDLTASEIEDAISQILVSASCFDRNKYGRHRGDPASIEDYRAVSKNSPAGIEGSFRPEMKREMASETIGDAVPRKPEEWDVALSFAGEDRAYVQAVANALKGEFTVFYDADEDVTLWGKDLGEFLSDVYMERARLVVMFVSSHYARKDWTRVERRGAFARALRERREYILPVRFDDTVLPGLLPTISYLNGRVLSPEELAVRIKRKLFSLDSAS
jgi:CheY-like chemotaxis protein